MARKYTPSNVKQPLQKLPHQQLTGRHKFHLLLYCCQLQVSTLHAQEKNMTRQGLSSSSFIEHPSQKSNVAIICNGKVTKEGSSSNLLFSSIAASTDAALAGHSCRNLLRLFEICVLIDSTKAARGTWVSIISSVECVSALVVLRVSSTSASPS